MIAEVKKKTHPRWIYVFETEEQDGFLSSSGKPRLYVCIKKIEPGKNIDRWIRTSKKAKDLKIKKVRYDLMPPPEVKGGLKQPFIYVEGCTDNDNTASELKDKLKEKLKHEGYVVLRNPRRLYVVELKPSGNSGRNAVGAVYVGQTSLPIEERIKQHRLGPKYPWKSKCTHSRRCHQRFVQPRLDLIPCQFKCIYGSLEETLVAESELRLHFEALGYEVIGGTERYEQQKEISENICT